MDQKPLTIVIFGSTGDLYQKKLARALFDLYTGGFLGKKIRIVGYGRRPYSQQDFARETKLALEADKKPVDNESFIKFSENLFYEKGNIEDPEHYKMLKNTLARYDSEHGNEESNKLFYLAVPPKLYETIFKNLAASGCADQKDIWARILVEKPFGNNLDEARKLDLLLGDLFKENQIFRIDHYLAKETLQNILAFRFSNDIFKPIWDKHSIEKVEIRFLEEHIVGDRGSFYDGIGALRDVGQNHMLQMLALIAMEEPKEMDSENIRLAREKVLKSVRLYKKNPKTHFERAQYEGYRSEKGVATDSDTETYFKVTLRVRNRRWRGVPFYFESGKGFGSALVDIKLFFKSDTKESVNILTFSLQPKEAISILFWSKKPGFDFVLEPQKLSFEQGKDELTRRIPDAYERVLFDCIRGDQTLFTSTSEVKSEWTIVMKLLELFKSLPLQRYKKGKIPSEFIAE